MSGELITTSVAKMSREQVDLLKRTVCKGATDDEFALFCHVALKSGLDPFAKQIHAVKRWDSNEERFVMSIQTGIDGYRVVANRTGHYAGNDEPKYGPEVGGWPEWATVTVYRIVAGQRCPFAATARWKEYKQLKKDGNLNPFWAKMPYLMLAKCAEALALRKAFPMELSNIYTHEEMGQADNDSPHVTVEVTPSIVAVAKPAPLPPAPAPAPVVVRLPDGTAPPDKLPGYVNDPNVGRQLPKGTEPYIGPPITPAPAPEKPKAEAKPAAKKEMALGIVETVSKAGRKDTKGQEYWGIKLKWHGTEGPGEPLWANTYHGDVWALAKVVAGSGKKHYVTYQLSKSQDGQKSWYWIDDIVEVTDGSKQ